MKTTFTNGASFQSKLIIYDGSKALTCIQKNKLKSIAKKIPEKDVIVAGTQTLNCFCNGVIEPRHSLRIFTPYRAYGLEHEGIITNIKKENPQYDSLNKKKQKQLLGQTVYDNIENFMKNILPSEKPIKYLPENRMKKVVNDMKDEMRVYSKKTKTYTEKNCFKRAWEYLTEKFNK